MSDPQDATVVADREASAWLVRLGESSVTADTLAEFQSWRSNPENAAAYQRVESLWRKTGALGGHPDIRAATREALAVRPNGRKAVTRRTWAAVAATGAVAVAGLGLGAVWMQSRGVYETGVGEQRLVRLEDGSTVRLDTASRLRVQFRRDRRDIALEAGQALFTVAADRDRLFTVTAGQTRVTAIGTIFDVRRNPEGARVTLLEGTVDVRNDRVADQSWRLVPGQQIVATASARPKAVDAALETSWAQGRLVFQNAALRDAVVEVNRYLPDKIVLDADLVETRALNGVFTAGDGDAFVAAVVEVFDLDAERQSDGGIQLSRARSPAEK